MTDPSQLTVLVTGATSGYGEATARRFLAAGARVIVTGRRADRLAAFAADAPEGRVHTLCFDVRDRDAVTAAIEGIPAPFDAVDVLVNNAGLALGLEPAWDTDLDDWDTMVDTNCKGLMYVTRAVLPGMVARGRGHVVNISSISGNWPYPGGNVYGATKAFVTQLSHNLRADLLGKPIRVTNIEPGLSKTEFSLVRFKGDADAAEKPYEGVDALGPDDIAEAVFWSSTLPAHVNIDRIELFPTMQAFGPLPVHRED